MRFRHGVRRAPDGGLRVTLSLRERDALRALPDTLRPVLSGDSGGDLAARVRERLFPRAYDDPDREQEYRAMVREDLVAARARALDAFVTTLDSGRQSGRSWSVELDAEHAELWLSVVNDARLALGTLLGITSEQHWVEGPEADNPASILLWYLGWLEEQLVTAMMGALPED